MKAIKSACRILLYAGLALVGLAFLRIAVLGASDYLSAWMSGTGILIVAFALLIDAITGGDNG